jgi:hypothetical protein
MSENPHFDLRHLQQYIRPETFAENPTHPLKSQGEEMLSVGLMTLASQVDAEVPPHELAEGLSANVLAYIENPSDIVKQRVKVLVSEAVTSARAPHPQNLAANS